MNLKILKIDVRELPAPLPLEEILKAVENLPQAHLLKVTHRQNPCVLFDIIKNKGYLYRAFEKNNLVEIYIWHHLNQLAEGLIQEDLKSV